MLSRDLVVYSAHEDRQARGISLLGKRTLNASVNLAHVNVGEQLIVADIDVKIDSFRLVLIYALKDSPEHVWFFR